jgi:hypothetical protein
MSTTGKSKASYAVPAVLYAIFVGTAFSPDVQPVLAKAFGVAPFGYPVAAVVAVTMAFVFLPFAVAIHHFMLIAEQAAADGGSVDKFSLLSYAVTAGQRHPHLRRSQMIALAGLIYFVMVCFGWIVYAAAKGI